MPYVFATIPLRETQIPGCNLQIECDVPASDVKTLQGLRAACVESFATISRLYQKSGCPLHTVWNSQEDREKYLSETIAAADAYAACLISLVCRFAKFGITRYYYWSSSLSDKQHISFDDYRYELSAVYFNVAAVLMNLSQYALCVRAQNGVAAPYEKETYRYLLRAVGYFSLVRTIISAMEEAPCSAAQAAFPVDLSASVLSFLGELAIAQAQEIAASRSLNGDFKGPSEVTVRLFHQVFLSYENAKTLGHAVYTKQSHFSDISMLVLIKCDAFRSVLYNHAAVYIFSINPSGGLRLLENAKAYSRILDEYTVMIQKKKITILYAVNVLLDDCLTMTRRSVERLTKINTLVHRAKASTEEVDVPPPLLLARGNAAQLPVPLPENIANTESV